MYVYNIDYPQHLLNIGCMEGYLDVWHGFFSRWNRYFFRIHEDTLIYGPKLQEIEGRIHLKVAQIISIVDDPISFLIHTGTQTLRIRASSIDDRVKWFKKLKRVQKQIEQANYIKQISSLKGQQSKTNKLRMLEQIVVQLWKSHAKLQNQIDDISQKFKSSHAMRSITDNLRMTVQTIKLKTTQALKLLEQYTRSQKKRDNNISVKNIFYARDNEFDDDFDHNEESYYGDPDGTKFMSFDDDHKNKNANINNMNSINNGSKRMLRKPSTMSIPNHHSQNHNSQEYYEVSQMKNTPLMLKSRSKIKMQNSDVDSYKINSPIRMISSDRNIRVNHPLKQKLLDTNVVFMETKKNIANNKGRSILPEKFVLEEKYPIGEILKGSVGTDLTRFALPVTVNEPISMLQKGCEQMYYCKLLDIANQQDTPQKRMLYVVAFLISQYSVSDSRIKKPFNPLLGQTFEFYDQQRQFTYISEQVSHHPPISAMYCRSDTFQVIDQTQAKTVFTGTCIKAIMEGISKIRLQKHPTQQYKYNKCSGHLNNVLIGKTTLEIVGDLICECKKSKTYSKITFKQHSFFNKNNLNAVEGQVKVNGQAVFVVSGKWNQYVKATDLRDKTTITLWNRKHVSNKQYYNFNQYTMLLNHLNKENLAAIAPTDSRLRPDQRALEYRNIEVAASEKNRVEEKQRAKRKQMEKLKMTHKNKWFTKQRDSEGQEFYVSNHIYDRERAQGEWANYSDIF